MATVSIITPSASVVAGLQKLLSDTCALTALTQNAHWNVTGSDFFQLHQVFGSQYEELFDSQDDLAERIRAIQGFVKANIADFAAQSNMPMLYAPFAALDAVQALLTGRERAIEGFKGVAKMSREMGDLTTENMLLDMIKAHEKAAWQLRSYLR